MRFLFVLLPFFALLCERSFFFEAYWVKVVRIYDGDTVLVRFGGIEEKLRFALLDAPELKQPGVGKYSRECLSKILQKNKEHRMTVYQRDKYGRLLGSLRGVSEQMVQRGCSGIYPFAEFKSAHEKMNYLRWLKNAREKHFGLWKFPAFLRPYHWRKLNKQNAGQRRNS